MSLWERLSPLEKGVAVTTGTSLLIALTAAIASYSLRIDKSVADAALEKFLNNNNPKITVSTAGYIGPGFESLGDGKVLFEPQSGTDYVVDGAFIYKNESPMHAGVRVAGKDTILNIGGVSYIKFQ